MITVAIIDTAEIYVINKMNIFSIKFTIKKNLIENSE